MGHGFDEMKMCGPTFSVWTGQDSTVQYLVSSHVRTKFKPCEVCQDSIPLPAPSPAGSDFARCHPGACLRRLIVPASCPGGMVPSTTIPVRPSLIP